MFNAQNEPGSARILRALIGFQPTSKIRIGFTLANPEETWFKMNDVDLLDLRLKKDNALQVEASKEGTGVVSVTLSYSLKPKVGPEPSQFSLWFEGDPEDDGHWPVKLQLNSGVVLNDP